MGEDLENLRNFNYYQFKCDPSITVAEYIFIDGTGNRTRGKTRVQQFLHFTRNRYFINQLKNWKIQIGGPMMVHQLSKQQQKIVRFSLNLLQCSQILLDVRQITKIIFISQKEGPHILVLAETYRADRITPARYNFRHICEAIMNEAKDFKPQFGIEQEYFFMKRTGTNFYWPLGWPTGGYPKSQGQYYCGVGESNVYGRAIAEAHLRLCLNAGLAIGGVNVEVAPGQFEYQVGVTDGIKAADEFWIARYILERVGEEFGVDIDYEPKPIKGDWNGSGGHCNFSTIQSRGQGGYEFIKNNYIPALDKTHQDILELYGANNRQRLTGRHETSSYEKFSWGDGSRAGSVRIPAITKHAGKGYLEDRRPAANLDAYLVTAALASVCCLGGKHLSKLKEALVKSAQPLINVH